MCSYRYLLLSFIVLLLQACSSITQPVHFYHGKPQSPDKVAHLKVPGPITITKIDGKKIKAPSIEEGFYDVYLLPGLHRIEFKYLLPWGDNISGMLIRSDNVGLETRFYAGKQYVFTYKKPSDLDEADDLARDFKATLVEEGTGRKVASRSLTELDEFRVTTGAPANHASAIATPQGIDANTASREDAVKRLKFWWLMANEDERKQFKEWLKTVENVK